MYMSGHFETPDLTSGFGETSTILTFCYLLDAILNCNGHITSSHNIPRINKFSLKKNSCPL